MMEGEVRVKRTLSGGEGAATSNYNLHGYDGDDVKERLKFT